MAPAASALPEVKLLPLVVMSVTPSLSESGPDRLPVCTAPRIDGPLPTEPMLVTWKPAMLLLVVLVWTLPKARVWVLDAEVPELVTKPRPALVPPATILPPLLTLTLPLVPRRLKLLPVPKLTLL